jgi:hypothetical protein
MTTGQIVAIVVLVLLVVAVVAAVLIFRKRSPRQRRLEAAQARREAEARAASAARLEAEAKERAERARAEQAQAEELAKMARQDREVAREQQARAEKLDPDHAGVEARPDHRRPAVADRTAHTVDARDGAHERTRDDDRDHPDRDSHRDAPKTSDDRPRHHDYERPEPIVGGAAAGMITPRQRHAEESSPTAPAAKDVSAPASGPAAVPAQHPTRPTPADGSAQDRPTVGEFVRDRSRSTGATDPSRREHPDSTDSTGPAAEQHHQKPARTLADRIMGRG